MEEEGVAGFSVELDELGALEADLDADLRSTRSRPSGCAASLRAGRATRCAQCPRSSPRYDRGSPRPERVAHHPLHPVEVFGVAVMGLAPRVRPARYEAQLVLGPAVDHD